MRWGHTPAGCDRGSDEAGLVSLEWLLIVAASIAIAITSSVAVHSVVDDSGEDAQMASRRQAAIFAAHQVVRDSTRDAPFQPSVAQRFFGWKPYYEARCLEVADTYSDTGIQVAPHFEIEKVRNNVRPDRIYTRPDMDMTQPPPRFKVDPNNPAALLIYENERWVNFHKAASAHCQIVGFG